MIDSKAGIGKYGEALLSKNGRLTLSLFKRNRTEKVIDEIIDTLDVLNIESAEYESYEYGGRVHIQPMKLRDLESGNSFFLLDDDLLDLMNGKVACIFAE